MNFDKGSRRIATKGPARRYVIASSPVLACDHTGKRLQAFLGRITYQGQNLRVEVAEETARRAFPWVAPVVADLAHRQTGLPSCWGDLVGDWQAGQAMLQAGHPNVEAPLPSMDDTCEPDPWWKESWKEQTADDDEEHIKQEPNTQRCGPLGREERQWLRSKLWKGSGGSSAYMAHQWHPAAP